MREQRFGGRAGTGGGGVGGGGGGGEVLEGDGAVSEGEGRGMNAAALREKRRALDARLSEPARVRLHRAISWLARAEQEAEDADAQFIFLWVSFNAAYARELGGEHSEREHLAAFFEQLLRGDHERRLQRILFEKFSGPIRVLVENRFVFEPFWRALRAHDGSGRWEEHFALSKRAALQAIVAGDTGKVLAIVFDRLYTLRNQLVHGGATWNSRINRQQVQDGARLLLTLLPVMIDVMLSDPECDFGPINYPVV